MEEKIMSDLKSPIVISIMMSNCCNLKCDYCIAKNEVLILL